MHLGYALVVALVASGCGHYSPESTLLATSSSEKQPELKHRDKLLLSGAIVLGGAAATCLFVIKTRKICRGLFRNRSNAEHNPSEAIAVAQDLKQELEHLHASHARLYEKYLVLEKQTSTFLGRQANINGLLLEHVSAKEIPLILQKRGIYVLETLQSVKGKYRNNGKEIVNFEIDAMFVTKDSVYFLEAKTHLHKSHADKLANHIANIKKATFDHPQISERLKRKEMKGIMSYVFDSSMPKMTNQQGKSASSYAYKTHGITTFRIFNWQEFKNKSLENIPKTAFAP